MCSSGKWHSNLVFIPSAKWQPVVSSESLNLGLKLSSSFPCLLLFLPPYLLPKLRLPPTQQPSQDLGVITGSSLCVSVPISKSHSLCILNSKVILLCIRHPQGSCPHPHWLLYPSFVFCQLSPPPLWNFFWSSYYSNMNTPSPCLFFNNLVSLLVFLLPVMPPPPKFLPTSIFSVKPFVDFIRWVRCVSFSGLLVSLCAWLRWSVYHSAVAVGTLVFSSNLWMKGELLILFSYVACICHSEGLKTLISEKSHFLHLLTGIAWGSFLKDWVLDPAPKPFQTEFFEGKPRHLYFFKNFSIVSDIVSCWKPLC